MAHLSISWVMAVNCMPDRAPDRSRLDISARSTVVMPSKMARIKMKTINMEKKEEIQTKLRQALAERDRLRATLDGRKDSPRPTR